MDDLTAWLTAQIEEDEWDATAALSGQADPKNGWGASRTPGYAGVAITPHVGHIHEDVQAAHVVRWSPARVLREIEAKRQILDEYKAATAFSQSPDTPGGGYASALSFTLRVLALPYSDRPGYREEWRP